jgi:cytochrome c553
MGFRNKNILKNCSMYNSKIEDSFYGNLYASRATGCFDRVEVLIWSQFRNINQLPIKKGAGNHTCPFGKKYIKKSWFYAYIASALTGKAAGSASGMCAACHTAELYLFTGHGV